MISQLKEARSALRLALTKEGKIPPEGDDKANMDDFPPVTGECTDMCPEYERWERQQTNRLSSFETSGSFDEGTPLVDHKRAVKAYARAAAGVLVPLPVDIRTPETLRRTNDYLISDILDTHHAVPQEAPRDGAIYNFLRDRFRAIRKDFRFQRYAGPELVHVLETQVRYLIYAGYAHTELDDVMFSKAQHQEQLMEAMSSLMESYAHAAKAGKRCANEAELRSYFVLLKANDSDTMRHMDQFREELWNPALAANRPLLHARNVLVLLQQNSERFGTPKHFLFQWGRFFRVAASHRTTYLAACLMWRQSLKVRRRALMMIGTSVGNGGRSAGPSLSDLTENLWFDNLEQTASFCAMHGLGCEKEDGEQEEGEQKVQFKEGKSWLYEEPSIADLSSVRLSRRLVDAKYPGGKLSELMLGGTSMVGVNASNRTIMRNICDSSSATGDAAHRSAVPGARDDAHALAIREEAAAARAQAAREAELKKEEEERRRHEAHQQEMEQRRISEANAQAERARRERERAEQEQQDAQRRRMIENRKARNSALERSERALPAELIDELLLEETRALVDRVHREHRFHTYVLCPVYLESLTNELLSTLR